MTGLHQQHTAEAEQREQEMVALKTQLDDVSKQLTQSSNHVTALEETIKAENAEHLQTKYSCERFQVLFYD